jgi:hypothetical protein
MHPLGNFVNQKDYGADTARAVAIHTNSPAKLEVHYRTMVNAKCAHDLGIRYR